VSKWPMTRLGEVADWAGGMTPSTSEPRFWSNSGIPWISSKDVKAKTLSDTERHVTALAVQETTLKLRPPGGIAVVVRSGVLAHTFPVAYVPFECVVNQDVKYGVPSSSMDGRYLAAFLAANNSRILKEFLKQGATVQSIEFDRLLDMEVPLPPLDEQKRIVAKLDEVAAQRQSFIRLLRAQENLIGELEHVASSAYESGTTWNTARLDEVCTIASGSTPSKAESGYWGGTVPWASAKDLKVEQLAQTQLSVTERAVSDGGLRLAAPGDLLILVRGMGLANGFQITTASVPMAFNQDLKCLHPLVEMDPDYFRNAVRRALQAESGVVTSAAHGTLKIETPKLVSIKIPVPPLEIQRELALRTGALKRQLRSFLITTQRRSELALDLERVVAEVALRARARTR
jgi:restriction endonuclease S subunit